MRLLLTLAALGLSTVPALGAASASDVIAAADASLTDTQRDEPGSTARAEAIAAALDGVGELPPAERLAVRLALAEAWLDGFQPARCAEIATAVMRDPAASAALSERGALARSAAASALLRGGDPAAAAGELDALATTGGLSPRSAAHLRIGRAELGLALNPERKPADAPAALNALDEALALLRDLPPAERVPVYLLRLTAMERGGAKPAEVLAWIQARIADPAAAEVAASAASAGDRLVGQPAPALKAARLDKPGEAFDLATLRGRPVLIDFFATWCAPCAAVAPAVARFAEANPEVHVVGISLDNPQTIADLPAFLAKHAITWPVVGEKLGWDGELDDAWRVDGIPSLILVAADGTVAATELVGGDTQGTVDLLEQALRALPKPARDTNAPFP
jgi:thiol-disulfide isomerase/thioredoxin